MRFTVADRTLEPSLRALMRDITMPGAIEIAYRREPDFFDALCVEGETTQVIAAIEAGTVVGMGCRSIRPMYINGECMDFGYLSSLRAVPSARRATGVARGYAYLRMLHDDGRVPAYISTIVEDNVYARNVLTARRAGLPKYDDWGRLLTFVLPIRRKPRHPRIIPGFRIVRGNSIGVETILEFINASGRRRQFSPVWKGTDFGTGTTRGLSADSFRVALSPAGAIAAVAALWDQREFRQAQIRGYHGLMRVLFPIIHRALLLAGYCGLSPAGSFLDAAFIALAAAEGDGAGLLRMIIDHIYADAAAMGLHYLILGFHERDPLQAAIKGMRALRYASRLYCVYWDDTEVQALRLDRSMVPGVEIATL